jgi:hypothetical protein
VATDADNVFLTLIAKQLNPDLFIVARAIQNTAKRTLQAAGAAKVISPYDLGARRMAHAILRPTVIKFFELAFTDESTDIMMEEIRVRPSSHLLNVALKDSGIRQQLDLIILTIKKADGTLIFNPKADTRIENRRHPGGGRQSQKCQPSGTDDAQLARCFRKTNVTLPVPAYLNALKTGTLEQRANQGLQAHKPLHLVPASLQRGPNGRGNRNLQNRSRGCGGLLQCPFW